MKNAIVIKIPRGWHRLRHGVYLKAGDKLFLTMCKMWWKTGNTGAQVGWPGSEYIYIRKNK